MISAVRDSWTAFSNWRLVIWIALPQLLSRLTRGSKMMFLMYLLEPILLVCMFYVIRGILRANTPNYGTSLFLFYASGALPFYLFMRISSKTRSADTEANSLLPGATAFDVYVASATLDTVVHVTTMVLTFYGMWLYGIDQARPASIVVCAMPVVLFIVLGIGVGMINNVICRYVPFWFTLYRILTRGLLFLSGVIIIVDFSPVWIREIAIFNPLSHGVEWFRLGVYGQYPHNFLDRSYLAEWALVALFLGFVCDRAAMRQSDGR